MATPPELTDGAVTLRRHTRGDVESLVTMGTDPETVRWTSVPQPYREQDALAWVDTTVPDGWRQGSAARWAIDCTDGFAGNLAIRMTGAPEIGFTLAPHARGRGVMSRAVRLATRWAFDVAELPVLHWSAQAGNLASWRVAHACGFTFDGTRPLALDQRGTLRDAWYASVRPADTLRPRTTWWPVPDLEDEGVRLRAPTAADVPRILEACSDPESQYWLRALPHPYTEEAAAAFVRTTALDAALGKRVSWAVTGTDDLLLAAVSVFNLDNPHSPATGEIGYWAHPDARGRGVVTAAVDVAVRHAFTPLSEGGLGRRRLMLGASWSNTASRRVAERAGFTLFSRIPDDGPVGRGAEEHLDDGAWYECYAT